MCAATPLWRVFLTICSRLVVPYSCQCVVVFQHTMWAIRSHFCSALHPLHRFDWWIHNLFFFVPCWCSLNIRKSGVFKIIVKIIGFVVWGRNRTVNKQKMAESRKKVAFNENKSRRWSDVCKKKSYCILLRNTLSPLHIFIVIVK